jgi:hypothetical protein
MHTSIVITRSRSREVAKQVAAANARIKACYPHQNRTTGQFFSPKTHTYEKASSDPAG